MNILLRRPALMRGLRRRLSYILTKQGADAERIELAIPEADGTASDTDTELLDDAFRCAAGLAATIASPWLLALNFHKAGDERVADIRLGLPEGFPPEGAKELQAAAEDYALSHMETEWDTASCPSLLEEATRREMAAQARLRRALLQRAPQARRPHETPYKPRAAADD